jgi:hypothetical protein
MQTRYRHAAAVGKKNGEADLYYPASNCLVADVALNAGRRGWRGLDREIVKTVQASLEAKSDADFWSVVGAIELRQYQSLANRTLASSRAQLGKAYQDLHERVSATLMWGSVYDTAFLVLPNYASRVGGRERAAAEELLTQLRAFARPGTDQ